MRSNNNRGVLWQAFIVFALFLSGCTMVGPNFVRPKATLSPNWMDVKDERVRVESVNYRGWWRVFNDPVLDRLIDRAYRENLSLRIAGVRVLEARAQLGIAVGGLFPQTQQAFGSLQYNRTSERAPNFTSSLLNFRQSEIGLQAAWELDFWGKFRRAIESADASLLATVADYDNALVSLTADVANSYVLIRTLEKTDQHCPSKRRDAKGEPEDRGGPVPLRHRLAIGCGAGKNGAQ